MNYYSSDKSTQILLALLKAHNIRYVIASPGTTNIALVGSMQYDSFFKMFSAPDERSAAYMACGLAAESGECVIITCTEATASRDYLPGLTEAYYRKLPILAITGHHGEEKIGHLSSQTIDRHSIPNDVAKLSINVSKSYDAKKEWENIININRAILELNHRGGGPVHINLLSAYEAGFDQKELPHVRKIMRYMLSQELPTLSTGRIAIFIGSHFKFSTEETNTIEQFCEQHDAVVFCDNTSGYYGKYRVNFSLVAGQQKYVSDNLSMDILIHLGEVSGATYITGKLKPKSVWRVSPDGELRDTFKRLTCVFEMDELSFFNAYNSKEGGISTSYYDKCISEYEQVYSKIPELPFSNIWMAKELYNKIPNNSVIHFGIFHSLRSWNFFILDGSVESSCNVGGFGIDGPVSTIIGASMARPDKLHFLIVGDLAFFYDLNSLGNRHVHSNLRILLVNNGRGIEFRKKDHPGFMFGEDADPYFAAAGHYGNMSTDLVKHYAEDLGFRYLRASSKEEFKANMDTFVSSDELSRPILFETFTLADDEVNSSYVLRNLISDPINILKKGIKKIMKS